MTPVQTQLELPGIEPAGDNLVFAWKNARSQSIHAVDNDKRMASRLDGRVIPTLCGKAHIGKFPSTWQISSDYVTCAFCRAIIDGYDIDHTVDRPASKALTLPAEFLPCVSDFQMLRVMADLLEEMGDPVHDKEQYSLARHLKWTANAWEWGQGTPRENLEEGDEVWARYSSQGWTRARVQKITAKHITVTFPHRRYRGMNGNIPTGKRAWWDLERRNTGVKSKPPPRKGYGTQRNAALAAALMG